jgi:hypothetical protein
MKCKIAGREVELDIDDRLQRSTDARRTTAPSGSSCEAAIQQTKIRRGESDAVAQSKYYPYKNKLEKAFAQQLEAEWRAGVIKGWIYEPFTFKLAEGKRYRVDFITWGEEGTVCYEVKGWHANIRDSLTHLSWAAQRFPFFKWRKAIRKGGGFEHVDIVV